MLISEALNNILLDVKHFVPTRTSGIGVFRGLVVCRQSLGCLADIGCFAVEDLNHNASSRDGRDLDSLVWITAIGRLSHGRWA